MVEGCWEHWCLTVAGLRSLSYQQSAYWQMESTQVREARVYMLYIYIQKFTNDVRKNRQVPGSCGQGQLPNSTTGAESRVQSKALSPLPLFSCLLTALDCQTQVPIFKCHSDFQCQRETLPFGGPSFWCHTCSLSLYPRYAEMQLSLSLKCF